MVAVRDTDPILARLIRELANADIEMVEADRQLHQAQAEHEIASVKFVALRDLVASRMGRTPYAPRGKGNVWRLTEDGESENIRLASQGRFRFYRVSPGDAAEAALEEAEQPLRLSQLTEVLKDGGADWATARAVNAAILNKIGKTIGKTDEDAYYVLGSEIDPARMDDEDLPFLDDGDRFAVVGEEEPNADDLPFDQ